MDELRGAFRVLDCPNHSHDRGGGTQYTDHVYPHPKWQSGASSLAEHSEHPPHHADCEGRNEHSQNELRHNVIYFPVRAPTEGGFLPTGSCAICPSHRLNPGCNTAEI